MYVKISIYASCHSRRRQTINFYALYSAVVNVNLIGSRLDQKFWFSDIGVFDHMVIEGRAYFIHG
jgi:hypothetical protein